VDPTPTDLLTCPKKAAIRTLCLSKDDYKKITMAVEGLWASLNTTCNSTFCPQADWAGCVLRLAGHDFMDFDGEKGGADGCLDFSDQDNAGLQACLNQGEHGVRLQTVYSEFCHFVSIADFIVMSAEAVMSATRDLYIKDTQKSEERVDFAKHFRFGRKTTASCSPNTPMPNPEDGCAAVQRTFLDQMGLTWAGAAALMGVHTLGRAQTANSGYNGWWSTPNNSRYFNNNYFIKMVTQGWRPHRAVAGNMNKNQWNLTDMSSTEDKSHQMMLNTDLCLVYTNAKLFNETGIPVLSARDNCCAWTVSRRVQAAIVLDDGNFCGSTGSSVSDEHMILAGGEEEHKACCDSDEPKHLPKHGADLPKEVEDCGDFFRPEGPAAFDVIKYANDESAWLKAFQASWTQATENGFKHLRELTCQCRHQ